MKPKSILVVEDDPLVRSYVCLVLETASLHYCEARDGVEAIGAIEANPDQFGLVLLDLSLPGASGWDVAVEIATRKPKLPILIMSGHIINETSDKLMQRSIAGFIQKPFLPDQLLREVRKHLSPNSAPPHPTA